MAAVRHTIMALLLTLALPVAARSQSDIDDVDSAQRSVGSDERRTCLVINAAMLEQVPKTGYGVLVILPGGDGSAEFNPFVRRIARDAAPEGFLVVQLAAPPWAEDQSTVWLTEPSPVKGQQFTMEEFIAAVLDDVRASHQVDEDRLRLMGWSSSGPVVYNMLRARQTPLGPYVRCPPPGAIAFLAADDSRPPPTLRRKAGLGVNWRLVR